MKFKSDFARLRYTGRRQPVRELELDSCGYYTALPKTIEVARKEGLFSHHFIFILNGTLVYCTEEGEKTAINGTLVYFSPGTPQIYRYLPGEDTCYYWLHFNGTRVDSFFELFPFKTSCYAPRSLHPYRHYIDQIIFANHLRRPGYPDYTNALLQLLLLELGQELFAESNRSPTGRMVQEMAKRIREAPEQPFSTARFAQEINRSENHLIRSFTREFGCSPQSFRKKLLIEKAKQLLLSTELNIAEIADLLHFSDPLYFSRTFKKEVGTSPAYYRKEKQ